MVGYIAHNPILNTQSQRASSGLSDRTDMRLSYFHTDADIFNIVMIYQVLLTIDNVLLTITYVLHNDSL